MKKLAIAGLSVAATLMLSPAAHASDSSAAGQATVIQTVKGGVFEGGKRGVRPVAAGQLPRPHMGNHRVGGHRWGNRIGGRWYAGFYAPGGWLGYRAPFRGYVLPGYWVNPAYTIGNFGSYGLPAPTAGWAWSRYYDDAVLRDQRGYVQDYRRDIDWDGAEPDFAPADGYYDRPDFGPAIGADRGIYDMDGPGMPTFTDEQGMRYDYDGQWTQGRYLDADGRVYEGQWNGRVTRTDGDGTGEVGAPYPMPPHAGAPAYPPRPAYATPYGFDRYERCLRSEGVAGAAIGAVIGAVAGNRIAGRGNRTEGSLIGGGLGALAGLGVEKSMKKCRKYLPDDQVGYAPAPAYPGNGYPGQGYYPGGYYYASPPMITTITVSQPVTTTTVTEEVYYETVPVKRKAVRKWKPRPKPRCVCR